MNKNYKNKKRVTIIILSILAVCLAVGLIWYVGTLGKAELPLVEPEVPATETTVTVPEINTTGTIEPGQEPESEQGTVPETEPEETQTETGELSTDETSGEETATVPAEARTDGKPQSPKDAVPPTAPPAETESTAALENPDGDGNCQPEHTQPQEEQPQGGDTDPVGAIYVPGFGYIESSGPNEQGISHTDGDWNKQIGTMQ